MLFNACFQSQSLCKLQALRRLSIPKRIPSLTIVKNVENLSRNGIKVKTRIELLPHLLSSRKSLDNRSIGI